jgi:hypothetical protein
MEVNGQLHAPAALPQGKSLWYPLDRRLGGPQSRSGRGGEEKNSQPPTELSRLSLYNDEVYHLYRSVSIIGAGVAQSI